MEKYYLYLSDEQKGPFTIGQLQAMWLAGTIDRNTQFYTKVNGDWKKLGVILDLLEPPPPATAAPAPVAAEIAVKLTEVGEKPAGSGSAPTAASKTGASVPLAPLGLGRCPECGGLGAHLSGCPKTGVMGASPPSAGTTDTSAVGASVPTPQQWRERMLEAAQSPALPQEAGRMVHQSFPMLNFFSSLMRGAGWLALIIGAMLSLAALAALVNGHGAAALGLLPALGLTLTGILTIVFGEMIGVLFSIEKNTFKATSSLDAIARSMRQGQDISRKPDKPR